MNLMKKSNVKLSQGVTLIELMIAVVIISILASIAYPSYQQHIMQAHRVDAQATLVSLSNLMEQQFTQSGSYANVNAPAASNYYLYIINATNTSYVLSATPIPGSAQDGDACGTLTLDNFGQKSADLTTGCWGTL